MGLEINTTTNQLIGTDGENVTLDSVKINILAYSIPVAAAGQTNFTLPFSYVEGNSFEVYINNILATKGSDYEVINNQLTWKSYKLYTEDKITVWG